VGVPVAGFFPFMTVIVLVVVPVLRHRLTVTVIAA
jgi:hypothetical protein